MKFWDWNSHFWLKCEKTEVFNEVLGPLTKLKANIDAVKRRSGFSAIKENYDGEGGLVLGQQDKPGSETSDSRGSISSGSQDILDENEEVSDPSLSDTG